MACLALLALQLGLLALPIFGFRSYAILTGSMVPALPVGSLIVTRDVVGSAVRPGDVITYPLPSDPSVSITHRVTAIESNGAETLLVTKGDANAVSDGWHVPAAERVGILVADIPFGGYLVSTTSRVLLAIMAVLLLIRRRLPAEPAVTTS